MGIIQRIKTVLQEAELYQSQGLLVEAREKYNTAANLIQKLESAKNRKNLLDILAKKTDALDSSVDKLVKVEPHPEMPPKVQDLIKKIFSYSKDSDKDAVSLEGAITLAKFGQIDRALMEFNELTKKDAYRIVASKNILRCYIANSTIDNAITQYQQWISNELYTVDQLENIRFFLEDLLKKRKIDKTLPPIIKKEKALDNNADLENEEEMLDINSIGINFDQGPHKGKTVELEVSFQTGNMISLIISSKDKELIENLKVGFKLDDVQFYSPVAIFQGSGIVSAKTKISSGPKRGDYSLDIKIVSS